MNKGYAMKTARRKLRRKYNHRKRFIIRGKNLMAAAMALLIILQIFQPQRETMSLLEGFSKWQQNALSVISFNTSEGEDAPDLRYQNTPADDMGTVAVSRGGEARDNLDLSQEEVSNSLDAVQEENSSEDQEKSLKVTVLEKLAAVAFPAAKRNTSKAESGGIDKSEGAGEATESQERITQNTAGEVQEANVNVVDSTEPTPVNSDNPQVLIYHTHATEAYLPTAENNYHSLEETDTVREVGTVLASELNKNGITTYQDKTLHDNPSFSKSYNRSLETAKNLIHTYPNAQLVIDLHRDASSAMGDKPKTVVVNGETIAAFCLVVGTGNENAAQLRALAEEIMATANEMYPGICRNIVERPYKFNGYLSDNFILLEIGNNANTIEQAKAVTPYIAEVLSKVI